MDFGRAPLLKRLPELHIRGATFDQRRSAYAGSPVGTQKQIDLLPILILILQANFQLSDQR